MVQTSLETWDSVDQEGCESVYYFGKSNKQNSDKFIYLPVQESLLSMGQKPYLPLSGSLITNSLIMSQGFIHQRM